MENRYENRQAFRIAAYFAGIGLLWIYGSDYLVELFSKNTSAYRLLQSIKGSFFVIVVSSIIFFLVRGLLFRIKANNQDIVASEERLIEAQRIAKLGDFEWYYNTGKVTWSAPLYELLGYNKSEQINADIVNNEIHYPPDLEQVKSWLNETVNKKETILIPNEYRIIKKNKSVIYVRTSGVVDYSDPSSPVIFATVQDINERKLADVELLKKNDELKESLKKIEQINTELENARKKAETSDRLKSAFLANMSHEIRTPLNGIMGFSELMYNAENLDDMTKIRYSEIIKKCAEGLLQIVNDILDISSLESGNLNLSEKQFTINQVLEDLYVLFQSKINDIESDCTLKLTPTQDIMVKTDQDRLRQILINLIDNAIKFTERGGIEFGVHRVENSMVTLFVKDTGIGIPAEYHEVIFDRFRQAGNADNGSYGGNGLGLSIVKELLQLMNGDIWLESEVDKGTVFYVSVPGIGYQSKTR